MAGYQAELAALAAASGVLRETVDLVDTARDQLDAGACADLGPGRLGPAAARLVDDARQDLDRVHETVTDDAERLAGAERGYGELDRAAADAIVRRTT